MASEKRKQDDLNFEIAFYEGLLAKQGDFEQALIALGDLYTKKGLYEEGLAIDKKLSCMRPDDPIVLYNLSCSYSLTNQLDKALAVMKLAIQSGYDNFAFLEADKDLENLKKDERFQSFYSQLKKEYPGSRPKFRDS